MVSDFFLLIASEAIKKLVIKIGDAKVLCLNNRVNGQKTHNLEE
jgi:hypothetical protein